MMLEEDDWVSLNATFPQKLYALMHHEDNYESIAWLDHGKSFRLLNPDRFSTEVIPKYFKHAKLTSFQRQLNLYGFRRVTKGEDQGAYFHPKFQHERQDLLEEIRRLPNKSALQSERASYPYYGTTGTSLNLRNHSRSSSSTSRSTFLMKDNMNNGNSNNNNNNSSSGSNYNNMTVVTRNSAAAAQLLSATNANNISSTSSKSSSLGESSNGIINYNNHATRKIFDDSPDTQIPLPKKMSKLSMNIGFGRDLRQGWLKPPVKRRREMDFEGNDQSNTNNTDTVPSKKINQYHTTENRGREFENRALLSDPQYKSDQLGVPGLFNTNSSLFNVSVPSDLHRVDSQTWDIPDLDDGLNFSELFA